VTPRGTDDNHQAVAEFQGQYMADADLVSFFKKYVTTYKEGSDDVVSKFVGDPDKQQGQTEASLDIQFIMGVNPGIKTEFWLYNSMDFCGDLANWTTTILADKSPPLIHSVSYGWQGDLAQLHCEPAKIKVVDDNFAKLAAKGISIVFASGDSGSGYKPSGACQAGGKPVTLQGTVKSTAESQNAMECCSRSTGAAAWMFTPGSHSGPPPPPRCQALSGMVFKKDAPGGSTSKVANQADCCAAAGKAAAHAYLFDGVSACTVWASY